MEKEILNAILNKAPTEAAKAFNDAVLEKIEDKLDAMRKNIAADLFADKEEENE